MEYLLSKRLRELREERNYSLRELAEDIGIPRTTLNQYELGQRIPNIYVGNQIAEFFDVSMEYLLGISDYRIKKIAE